jgi:osmotically-inducible protein OsmY
MIGALLRLILLVVVLAAVAAFFLGYRFGGGETRATVEQPSGTPGAATGVDTKRAREAGAEVGEKVATGANQAQRALAEGTLTGKIKSKMALDDLVQASRINVDTAGGVVTRTGTVRSEAERARAVQLARETEGVVSVTDRLVVK